MVQHYKILGAMLSLGEFSVSEIVSRTGCKSNTVYTALRREQPYIESVSEKKTARKERGGQCKHYRIKPNETKAIESRLEHLYKQISPSFEEERKSPPPFQIPLGLLVAEDTLRYEYDQAKSLQEKQQLFKLAKLDFDRGRLEVDSILSQVSEASVVADVTGCLNRVNALVELYGASLAVEEQASGEVAQRIRKVGEDARRFHRRGASEEVAQRIRKATSLLHELPPRFVWQAQISQSNRLNTQEPIYLIDGIDESPDRLTEHLLAALQSGHFPVEKVDRKNLSAISQSGLCIITVNSGKDIRRKEKTLELCKSIFASGISGRNAKFFDNKQNIELRNLLINDYHADYQPNALQLKNESILSYVGLK